MLARGVIHDLVLLTPFLHRQRPQGAEQAPVHLCFGLFRTLTLPFFLCSRLIMSSMVSLELAASPLLSCLYKIFRSIMFSSSCWSVATACSGSTSPLSERLNCSAISLDISE